jgi:ATP-dependent helicase/nuclease subunit A
MPAPDSDVHIRFPSITAVTASAGSGKTQALTNRLLQFMLSERIPNNKLKNILAVTFTNNAAHEMRERVIGTIKRIALGDHREVEETARLVSGDPSRLRMRAENLIALIFESYSDFQVRTIDSFMVSVFKSASVEFGFHPDFDILLTREGLIDEAFERLSREMVEHPERIRLMEQLVDLMTRSRSGRDKFVWDPFGRIADEVKKLYAKLNTLTRPVVMPDDAIDFDTLKSSIGKNLEQVRELIAQSRLEPTKHFETYLASAREGDLYRLSGRAVPAPPVKKPGSPGLLGAYKLCLQQCTPLLFEIEEYIRQYTIHGARTYYRPYVEAIALIRETLLDMKRQYGRLFIDDVNKILLEGVTKAKVPEIYYKLGDTIYHYLIDEFQDSSPVQWEDLKPLIENSLSQGGSLFVVGDPKQSIYGFRGADYRIMKQMETQDPFPSAKCERKKLGTNWRSHEKIVRFNEQVFQQIVPLTEYARAGRESGLNDVRQDSGEQGRGRGYVEVVKLQKDDINLPERKKLVEVVRECQGRGYSKNDIAVLTPTNRVVVEVSSWLNAEGIEFISHSSLDVRARKVTGELVALLNFLDSPVDDLSLATFLLGHVFGGMLANDDGAIKTEDLHDLISQSRYSREPLYKLFQQKYPAVWEKYFEQLFTLVGYLPLYDMVSAAMKTFRVFETHPTEEAALAKMLEVVKTFEDKGNNNLKDFLEFAEDETEDSPWNIAAPLDADAVSIMTIHKAKGLGFRVVIVLVEDSRQRARPEYIIDEKEDGVELLRISSRTAEKDEHLKELYQQHELNEQVDELNKLYVALTRAKEEMYVISVYDEKPRVPSLFLPDSGYEPGLKPIVERTPVPTPQFLRPHHHNAILPPPATVSGAMSMAETRRGEAVHEVLAGVEFIEEDLRGQIASVLEMINRGRREKIAHAQTSPVVERFLSGEVKEYFLKKKGRRVWREQEFAAPSGALYRADRIVIDNERVTVLDFKTGGDENEAEYREQIQNYTRILRDVIPGKLIEGVIAYVDKGNVKVVR